MVITELHGAQRLTEMMVGMMVGREMMLEKRGKGHTRTMRMIPLTMHGGQVVASLTKVILTMLQANQARTMTILEAQRHHILMMQ